MGGGEGWVGRVYMIPQADRALPPMAETFGRADVTRTIAATMDSAQK